MFLFMINSNSHSLSTSPLGFYYIDFELLRNDLTFFVPGFGKDDQFNVVCMDPDASKNISFRFNKKVTKEMNNIVKE